jgi:hypothetical protein
MTIISITTKTAITDPAITPALLPLLERFSGDDSPVKQYNERERIKTKSIQ